MVDVGREIYERNVVETIVGSDVLLWLNEKHIEKGLGHKHLPIMTKIYSSNYRKHRHGLVDESKNKSTDIF